MPLTSFFSTRGSERSQSIRLGSSSSMRYWVRRRSWISCGSSRPYSPSKASRTQSSQFPLTAAVIGIASSKSKRSSLPGPGNKMSPKSQYSVAPRARASAITASRALVSPWISDKMAIRWFITTPLSIKNLCALSITKTSTKSENHPFELDGFSYV